MAVQGQPKSLTSVRRFISRKSQIFTIPLSFNALVRGEHVEFLDEPSTPRSRIHELSVGEDFVILACIVLTQCQRMSNREMYRHLDRG